MKIALKISNAGLLVLNSALCLIARNMHNKLRTKVNQREIIQKLNKVELWFLCTAFWVIARNMHTKFGVIWTYGNKVTLQTRNAL